MGHGEGLPGQQRHATIPGGYTITGRPPKNIAHSIRQRLLNEARDSGRSFNELLQYFAMERFLYRLTQSPYADKFVLKGALLLTAWRASRYRATRDIDLLGRINNSLEHVAEVFRDVCRQDVEVDGIIFQPDTVTAQRIAEDADYEGVRVDLQATLGTAKIRLQVDIGFSDVVVPSPTDLEYPTIIDLPAPHLKAYSRETMVAEKFEAMVNLGQINSRMKDFADVWFLSRHFNFDGAVLANAIAETFRRRSTTMPANPVPLSQEFAENPTKQTQWAAFLRRGKLTDPPANFAEAIDTLRHFLLPLAQTIAAGEKFTQTWVANGRWKG